MKEDPVSWRRFSNSLTIPYNDPDQLALLHNHFRKFAEENGYVAQKHIINSKTLGGESFHERFERPSSC